MDIIKHLTACFSTDDMEPSSPSQHSESEDASDYLELQFSNKLDNDRPRSAPESTLSDDDSVHIISPIILSKRLLEQEPVTEAKMADSAVLEIPNSNSTITRRSGVVSARWAIRLQELDESERNREQIEIKELEEGDEELFESRFAESELFSPIELLEFQSEIIFEVILIGKFRKKKSIVQLHAEFLSCSNQRGQEYRYSDMIRIVSNSNNIEIFGPKRSFYLKFEFSSHDFCNRALLILLAKISTLSTNRNNDVRHEISCIIRDKSCAEGNTIFEFLNTNRLLTDSRYRSFASQIADYATSHHFTEFPTIKKESEFLQIVISSLEELMLLNSNLLSSVTSPEDDIITQGMISEVNSNPDKPYNEKATDLLNLLEIEPLPSSKLHILLSAAKAIFGAIGSEFAGADEFLPQLIASLSRATDLKRPAYTRDVLWKLSYSEYLHGEEGYYIASFDAALEYFKSTYSHVSCPNRDSADLNLNKKKKLQQQLFGKSKSVIFGRKARDRTSTFLSSEG